MLGKAISRLSFQKHKSIARKDDGLLFVLALVLKELHFLGSKFAVVSKYSMFRNDNEKYSVILCALMVHS